jgi:hypothetical protein
VLVINRLCGPDGKLAVDERWYPSTALDDLLGTEEGKINDARLYRFLYKTGISVCRLGAKVTPARGAGNRGCLRVGSPSRLLPPCAALIQRAIDNRKRAPALARDRASSARQQVRRIFERDPDAVRRPRPQAKMPCQARQRSCPSARKREWRGRTLTENSTPRRRAGFAPCSTASRYNLHLIGRLDRQWLSEPRPQS